MSWSGVIRSLALGACVVMASCEKIREASEKVAGKAKETVVGGVEEGDGGEVEARWQELIDLDESGYRFRRDLPFPEQLEVRVESAMEFRQARVFHRSALGSMAVPLEGTVETVAVFGREASKVSIEIERSRFVEPLIEDEQAPEEGSAEPAEGGVDDGLEGLRAEFIRLERGWRRAGEEVDFRMMAWANDLEEDLDAILPGMGVVPRSPWFGLRRLLPGATLTLKDGQMALVLGHPGKGSLQLRFDRVESVNGHPCAVFAYSGDYSTDAPLGLSGQDERVEASIEAGEAWCSLIHPLVLRDESEGVITSERRGPGGELVQRVQGAVKIRRELDWQPGGGE